KPALTHSLWLLVLLKLVTPPLLPVALPWSWDEPEPAAAVKPAPAAPAPPILIAQAQPALTALEPNPQVRKTNIKEVGDPRAIGKKCKEPAKDASKPAASDAESVVIAQEVIPTEPVVEIAAPAPMPAPESASPPPVRLRDLAPFFGTLW